MYAVIVVAVTDPSAVIAVPLPPPVTSCQLIVAPFAKPYPCMMTFCFPSNPMTGSFTIPVTCGAAWPAFVTLIIAVSKGVAVWISSTRPCVPSPRSVVVPAAIEAAPWMTASMFEAKADFGSFKNRCISSVRPEYNSCTGSRPIDAAQEMTYLNSMLTRSLAVASNNC